MNNNHINIVWCCRRSPATLFLIMIFRDFSGFFRIFRDFSGFSGIFGIFRDFPGFFGIFRDFSGFFRIFRDFSGFLKYRCMFFKVKSLQMIKHILIWFSDCPRANYYTYQPLERDSANFTWPCVVQILTVVGERSLKVLSPGLSQVLTQKS